MSFVTENSKKIAILYLEYNDWIWINDQSARNNMTKKEYLKTIINEFISLKKQIDHSNWKLEKSPNLKSINVEMNYENWAWICNEATKRRIHKKEFFTKMVSEIVKEINMDSTAYSIKKMA